MCFADVQYHSRKECFNTLTECHIILNCSKHHDFEDRELEDRLLIEENNNILIVNKLGHRNYFYLHFPKALAFINIINLSAQALEM